MASVSNQLTTFNLDNYLGELFLITPFDAPLLSMLGGLGSVETNESKEDVWQTTDNASAAQTTALEGADPTYAGRDRAEVSNVKQIYQYGVEVSYTKRAATGNFAAAATPALGIQPVRDELDHQLDLKMKRMATDVEYTLLQGTYAKPADNNSARSTRGLKNAITTNTVDAGDAVITKAHFNEVLREMANSGAPFSRPVVFANAFNRQKISDIWGHEPESRTVGGVSIKSVLTDFCELGVVYDRHMPTDEIYIVDVAQLTATALSIPEKGTVFVEPLAHTGASWKYQLYGELGFKYGPEKWHGSITNTASSE